MPVHPAFKALLEVDMGPFNKARRRNKQITRARKAARRKRRQTNALIIAGATSHAIRRFIDEG